LRPERIKKSVSDAVVHAKVASEERQMTVLRTALIVAVLVGASSVVEAQKLKVLSCPEDMTKWVKPEDPCGPAPPVGEVSARNRQYNRCAKEHNRIVQEVSDHNALVEKCSRKSADQKRPVGRPDARGSGASSSSATPDWMKQLDTVEQEAREKRSAAKRKLREFDNRLAKWQKKITQERIKAARAKAAREEKELRRQREQLEAELRQQELNKERIREKIPQQESVIGDRTTQSCNDNAYYRECTGRCNRGELSYGSTVQSCLAGCLRRTHELLSGRYTNCVP
jgi:hypothetical protein